MNFPRITPPPPRASPRHPGDGPTKPGVASTDYVKRKISESAADVEVLLQEHDNKLTIRSVLVAVGSVVAGVVSMVLFVDNRVAAQTDAGVKVHESRISTLEQQRTGDRSENNIRFERIELSQQRTEKKLDALLDRLDVRNPAPTPKDGGR